MSAKSVVVLGASRNRSKYGNKAVRAYSKASWTVYPVNNHADAIEGIKAFRSMGEIPGTIDRVTVYLPPDSVLPLLEDIARLHPTEVFFNPGSDSLQVIERATSLGLNAISDCSIVNIGMSPSQFPG